VSISDTAVSDADAKRRLPAGRKAQLLAVVTDRGEVTVAELAEQFAVSVDTVRRDLDSLGASGQIIRTHGGAISPAAAAKPETGLDVRRRVQTGAKDTIGALAAKLVPNGSTVIINAGTTALAVAAHLHGHSGLTLATNNLLLTSELDPRVYRNLYVFGGTVRANDYSTIGPLSFGGFAGGPDVEVRCDIALIAVGGITADGGYCTSNLAEASMMREMMDRADTVVVILDSTKFGRKLFAQFAPLDAADFVVTEKRPADEFVTALESRGVTLITP
jgi:DeoR family fructose operon transcriptional repressor